MKRVYVSGLILSLMALLLFGLLAWNMTEEGRLTHWDEPLARDLERHAEENPVLLTVLRFFTDLGGIPAMVILTAVGSVILLWRRQRLAAAVWVLAAITGGLLTLSLKTRFDRPRPFNPDRHVFEKNESFPSGHSMGALIGYGMLAYLCLVELRRKRARAVLLAGLLVLVLLIGFSRIYLRAHWFSDVIGGYLAGVMVLGISLVVLESSRRRSLRGVSRTEEKEKPESKTETPLQNSLEKLDV
jgi:undecaprenyl-diphosphatase